MIIATSQFRVANGKAEAVRAAFLHRPRLVDRAPGFLGMEVFVDEKDPSIFYLVTRWTDEVSFTRWHGSEAHRESHRGIPKGLKLDRDYTETRIFNRIEEPTLTCLDHVVADTSLLLSPYLSQSEVVHILVVSHDGTIVRCNQAVVALLGADSQSLNGQIIWDLLTNADANTLRQRVLHAERNFAEMFLLNFVPGPEQMPITLKCQLDIHPDYFVLIGEPPAKDILKLKIELLHLNNELAINLREKERLNKELTTTRNELQQALTDLETTYWHFKKIQECLPICMECGKVKSADTHWESVADYFKRNALFLSHGYCPTCAEKVLAHWKSVSKNRKK